MFTSATPVSVAELAQLLMARKKQGKRTLLFLGAGAGRLFGNQAFYDDLQRFSERKESWNLLSSIEKFKECYLILKGVIDNEALRDPDTRKVIEKWMNEWLKEETEQEINNYVAELAKKDFFDIIISANINSSLEDTFGTLGMRRSQDYNVVNILDLSIDLLMCGNPPCTIVKVFDDSVSGNYKTMMGEISWKGGHQLRVLLNSLQNRDLLAIGYDPLWDKQIEAALLLKGELWYVNETLPEHNSAIVKELDLHQGKYLVGIDYERFFRELSIFIQGDEIPIEQSDRSLLVVPRKIGKENSSISDDKMLEVIENKVVDSMRKKVFISYSHKDKKYVERLLVHLNYHIGNEKDLLDVWCDTRFEGSEDWHKEIQEAIATTKVAIFLVSSDFLISPYIKEHELPPLMKAAGTSEVALVSVIVSPCGFPESGLSRYHSMNNASLTLLEMDEGLRERVWEKTARRVKTLLFSD